MDLRKLTLVIFLNDGLDVTNPDTPQDKTGSLRLYTGGDTVDGVIDIQPRIGRAVLFKSEELLHKVNPLVGQDNTFLTFYFTQVVDKPPPHHPIPDTWKIFVGIASYRDSQLIGTLKAMIRLAAHPERLRILALNQYNFNEEWDLNLVKELKEFIALEESKPNAPDIVHVEVPHHESKNCYGARVMIQEHFKNETYQL